MEIIFVKDREEGYQTKVKGHKLRPDETFHHWVTRFELKHPHVDKLYIYDIISCDRYFCDQGCQPGMGCKKEYSKDNHALIVRYDYTVCEKDWD